MQKQKKNYVPTINGVPMGTLNAALDFTTDFIEFPESTPWSVQIEGWNGITLEGSPVITIYCSNVQDGEYVEYDSLSTLVDIKVASNRVMYDSIFAPRFMKIRYISAGTTGTFKLTVSK
jgi:hypothetical protein